MKESIEDTKNVEIPYVHDEYVEIPYVQMNIAKMTILPKAICRFISVPFKISASFFIEIEKKILKFICNCKDSE
jgi:hypothetical protein